ncbi:MAG: hypothetical protein CMJ47_09140 [Planctomyces sp.]|nr:hypothetical protein [Planctomyces sp.]
MSSQFQLLCHFTLLGITLGWGIASFPNCHWLALTFASLIWIAFWFHLAAAVWITQWGKGRDWIDRVGILIRGSSLVFCALAVLVQSPLWSAALGATGIFALMLGRAVWEMMVVPRVSKPADE